MKKIIILFCLLAVAFSAQAQIELQIVNPIVVPIGAQKGTKTEARTQFPTDSVRPSVYRSGNYYFVGTEQLSMKEFMWYLEDTRDELYKDYHSGYVVSKVGWPLFYVGLSVTIVGSFLSVVGGWASSQSMAGNGEEMKKAVNSLTVPIAVSGAAVLGAGITCLGVGYARMHKVGDIYNVVHPCQQPETELKVISSANGVGIALAW